MKILENEQFEQAKHWMEQAAKSAQNSTCQRAKCGSVIVADNEIIGQGYNSPAGGEPNRCMDEYLIPEDNKFDVTCCPHAEVRAAHNAFKNNPEKLKGSTLYFMRVDNENNQTFAGVPYCTTCSKEALDSGIKSFVLWHKDGITEYDTQEYNDLSYKFYKDQSLWLLK